MNNSPVADRPSFAALSAQIGALAMIYGIGGLVGFTLLVLLFRLGALAAMDMLFFRGLLLIVVAFAATFGLLLIAVRRWPQWRLGARDAFCAAILSVSFNISFFVLFPVTVDRSVSIFILGEMTAHPERTYSPDEMNQLFSKVYVGDYRQIDRRLHEQTAIGNVEKIGAKYRISNRGRSVIETSKFIARLFDSDTRLVAPTGE